MPPDYAKVRRQTLAEAVVLLTLSGRVRGVPADDLAEILGVDPSDVRAALDRMRREQRQKLRVVR